MTIDAARIAAALADTNLRAFLAVIRAGEGTADGDGYRRCYGGSLFDSFADHPRRTITAGRWTSTAAGAYQFLARTWDGLVKQYAFPDFSPASQDAGAVALIAGRKALDDVLAGRIQAAIRKCNLEWASLPGSPYGQPTRTLAQALATYAAAGGVLEPAAQASSDSPAPAPAPHSKEGFTMPPFLLAALPALIQAIPSLAQLFGAKGEQAEQKIAAVQQVAQIVQDATGAKNIQEAVESIQADPAMLQSATQAVQAEWFALTPADGGGISGAREADTAFMAAGRRSFESPAFLISIALLLLPFMLVVDTLFVHPANYTAELRTQIVTGVLLCISSVGAFWLGSSFGSMKKTEAAQSGAA